MNGGSCPRLPMNTSLKVPRLTKEGSGEVMQWRISNLPLAPSLVRRGFTGPTHRRRADKVLRASSWFRQFNRDSPLTLRRPIFSGAVSKRARWNETRHRPSHCRLLLRHAVKRAQPPHHFARTDADDAAVWKELRERTERHGIVAVVENRHEDHTVGDVEIGVARRQALAIVKYGRR